VSTPEAEYYCPECDTDFPVPEGTREPVLCGVAGHPPMRRVEVRYVADGEHGHSGA
jgi:hypothetical protein